MTTDIHTGHKEMPWRLSPVKRDSERSEQGDVCAKKLLRKQLFTAINSVTAASVKKAKC